MKKSLHASQHPVLLTTDPNARSGRVGPLTIIRTTPEVVRSLRRIFGSGDALADPSERKTPAS